MELSEKISNFMRWKIAEIFVFGDDDYFRVLTKRMDALENFSDSEIIELKRILEAGVDAGNIYWMLILSHLYEKGEIYEKNIERAQALLERAAESGNSLACVKLALNCFERPDVLSRKYKVEDIFENILASDSQDGIFPLIRVIKKGRFGSGNLNLLRRLFERGVEHRSAEIMRIYALEIINGSFGQTDRKRALTLLEDASGLGDAQSMFEIAECFRHGKLGEANYEKAQNYYEKAAKKGFRLAGCYLTNPMIKAVCAELDVPEVSENIKKHLKQALIHLEEKSFTLREKHRVNEDCYLSHFTTWSAIESILNFKNSESGVIENKNVLRQFHVDYMNDPSEGRRLLFYRPDKDNGILGNVINTSEILNGIFERNYFGKFSEQSVTAKLRPSVFMLSLTRESDRLDLWRAYGGDGKGYCIKLPFKKLEYLDGLEIKRNRQPSALFHRMLYGYTSEDLNGILEQDIGTGGEISQEICAKLPIAYDVKYSNRDVEETLLELSYHLDEIFSLKENFDDSKWQKVEECICSILLELLYLYKDEQYSTEREARVLSVLNLNDERIKSDERSPGHLYCETEPFLFTRPGSEVILGPKVEKKAAHLWNIRYRLTKLGFDGTTTVKESEVLYR